jgi:hypothetical protein
MYSTIMPKFLAMHEDYQLLNLRIHDISPSEPML